MPLSKTQEGLDGGVYKNPRRAPKSRSGCQTCKVKRLKCDETKPACYNCIRRGLTCPGYKQVLKWSTKYEANADENASLNVVHPSVEYHFSTIDPITFEKDLRGADCGVGKPRSQIEHRAQDTLIEQTSTTHKTSSQCHAPADKSDAFIHSHEELMPAWTVDLPGMEEPVGNAMMPYVPLQPNTHDRNLSRAMQTRCQSKQRADAEQWKSLLRSYYRMSEPSLPRALQTEGSALIEHYFRDVCVIFSSFDSAMNPFRTVIARLWDNSSSIYFAIQSMAAAHLANSMPSMRLTGLAMQKKAYECLQQELQLASINQTMDDKLLLTVLLLGLTACWHDSSDLGVAHLSAARALIHPRLLRDDPLQSAESKRNDQFFAEALIYWEMCMAFVSQETFTPGQERRLHAPILDDPGPSPTQKIFPHPWTGIAPRVQMLFAEVGRLVRHHCTLRSTLTPPSFAETTAIVTAAKDLEEELLSITIPPPSALLDVQDERTRPADFVNVAEATKCAALLQIYRVFPSILASRLGQSTVTFTATSTHPDPLAERAHGFAAARDTQQTSWLTSFAMHILDLLALVPWTSGNRPQQLILLVTAATELRAPLRASSLVTPSLDSVNSTTHSSLSPQDSDIARTRAFAMKRLQELAARLPSRPVVRIIELVREVWRRSDGGDEDVFWMDVMTVNGWETVMG